MTFSSEIAPAELIRLKPFHPTIDPARLVGILWSNDPTQLPIPVWHDLDEALADVASYYGADDLRLDPPDQNISHVAELDLRHELRVCTDGGYYNEFDRVGGVYHVHGGWVIT